MTKAGPAGFTLLEVMVTLVVFGFLMIGLAQGVHFGFQGWYRQTALLDKCNDLSAADNTLRSLITAMQPGFPNDAPNIVGRDNAFAFTSELPKGAGLNNRDADILLSLDNHHQLLLTWTPHFHATRMAGAPRIQNVILLSGVSELNFSYWNSALNGGAWTQIWNSRVPPTLVRIKIVLIDGATKSATPRWPEIIISPMRSSAD